MHEKRCIWELPARPLNFHVKDVFSSFAYRTHSLELLKSNITSRRLCLETQRARCHSSRATYLKRMFRNALRGARLGYTCARSLSTHAYPSSGPSNVKLFAAAAGGAIVTLVSRGLYYLSNSVVKHKVKSTLFCVLVLLPDSNFG
jgi:hypothetical protein